MYARCEKRVRACPRLRFVEGFDFHQSKVDYTMLGSGGGDVGLLCVCVWHTRVMMENNYCAIIAR